LAQQNYRPFIDYCKYPYQPFDAPCQCFGRAFVDLKIEVSKLPSIIDGWEAV
jgi:hypothetical protein